MLLIDEVDRADDEFEAFLFEMLAEASVTIPELGTLRADAPPIVVLTSNRTRDLHDALRRRCLYHWIDYPRAGPGRRDHPRGACRHASDVPRRRRSRPRSARLRALALTKPPGVAEAINWAAALAARSGCDELDVDGSAAPPSAPSSSTPTTTTRSARRLAWPRW